MFLIRGGEFRAQFAVEGLIEPQTAAQGHLAVRGQGVVVELVQPACQPVTLTFVDGAAHLLEQDFFAAVEVARAFEEADQRVESIVGRRGQNAAGGVLAFDQRRLQDGDGRLDALVDVQGLGVAKGDVQPVEGAFRLPAIQDLQLTELFLGQRFLPDGAESGEEVGHQTAARRATIRP